MEVEQGVDVVPDRGHARAHVADQVEAPAERVVDRREAGGRVLVRGDLLERGAEHAHVAAGLVARCCQGDASMVSCAFRTCAVNVNVGPVPRWKPRTSPPRRRQASMRPASPCAVSGFRFCRRARARPARPWCSCTATPAPERTGGAWWSRPARFARAVAPDMPGFGRADKPRDFPYSWPAMPSFLDGVLGELGIDRVHLVVHDFGGPWGMEWAAREPVPGGERGADQHRRADRLPLAHPRADMADARAGRGVPGHGDPAALPAADEPRPEAQAAAELPRSRIRRELHARRPGARC